MILVEHEAQARLHEIEYLCAKCGVIRRFWFCVEAFFGVADALNGGLDDGFERHRLFVFEERAHDAVGRTAKCERVCGTSRDSAKREECGDRIDFVGDAGNGTCERRGDGGACLTRAVRLANARADIGRKAFFARVVIAHHALDFGKLVDDVRRQIGFTEVRGASDVFFVDVALPKVGDGFSERFVAKDFVVGRAHAFDVAHVREFFVVEFEVVFAIFGVEEFGVFEACDEDAFVAARDDFAVVHLGVGERDEVRHEVARVIDDAEVALVRDHARDDDFVRDLEEGRVE